MEQSLNTLIIKAVKADGTQNASIKLPLGLLHFAVKLARLLPASIKERIDKQLAEHGVSASFESLLSEGTETLQETLRQLEIDVHDEKQTLKVSVV